MISMLAIDFIIYKYKIINSCVDKVFGHVTGPYIFCLLNNRLEKDKYKIPEHARK